MSGPGRDLAFSNFLHSIRIVYVIQILKYGRAFAFTLFFILGWGNQPERVQTDIYFIYLYSN